MSALVPFGNKPFYWPTTLGGFSSMLDDFFFDDFPSKQSLSGTSFRLDIRDQDGAYQIDAELPGVSKDEIKLELNDNLLSITVERQEETEENKGNYLHRERRIGSMRRTVRLADAKADAISAKFENGVLQVTVPKEDAANRMRQIEIQ